MNRTLFALLALSLFAAQAAVGGEGKKKKVVTRPVVRGEKNAKFPRHSPDGSQIAFSLHGDIWTVPAEGGYARRITLSDAYDTKPRWSPDGKKIAFSSKRSGNWDIWVTAVDRGRPKRLTFDSAFDSVCLWSPDGKWIYFHSTRKGPSNIFRIPAEGGFAERLTEYSARDVAIAPDGRTLVYAYGYTTLSRKEYAGSSNWDLFVQAGPGAVPRRLTTFAGNDKKPFFWPGRAGDDVYYLSERKGRWNIHRIPLAGGRAVPVTSYDEDVNNPHVSADGKSLVFEKGFHLWRKDFETGNTVPVAIEINADLKGASVAERTITSGAEDPGWSPDGRTLVFQLRGDIWTMDAAGGKARRLTSGSPRDGWPKYSRDGKRIAFYSDRSGNKDLWIMDARGRNLQQVTFHKKDDFYHGWHPSGHMLVFCSERSGNKDIWTVDLRTGERKQLTKDAKNDDDPVYSPDGKWIAFDSGRTGQQNVYLMSASGRNLKRLTSGTFDQVPTWSPDGKFIAFERNEKDAATTICVVSRDGGPTQQIVASGSGPRWSPKGDLIAFQVRSRRGGMIHTVDAPKRLVTGQAVNFMADVE
ncbi:MAG: hypothetical protein ACYS47_12750, partial [Planctomycetota bacterium]